MERIKLQLFDNSLNKKEKKQGVWWVWEHHPYGNPI